MGERGGGDIQYRETFWLKILLESKGAAGEKVLCLSANTTFLLKELLTVLPRITDYHILA